MTNTYLDPKQLQELDALHHLHPFTNHKTMRAGGARVIVRADGPYIGDSEGRRMLDGHVGLVDLQRRLRPQGEPGRRRAAV